MWLLVILIFIFLGYLLAVEPWEGMPTTEEDFVEQFPDLKFIFKTDQNIPHFKSRRCIGK